MLILLRQFSKWHTWRAKEYSVRSSSGISLTMPAYRKYIKPSGPRIPAYALLWALSMLGPYTSPLSSSDYIFCFYPKLYVSQWDLHPGEQRAAAAHPRITCALILSPGPLVCFTAPRFNELTLNFIWTHVLKISCASQEPGGCLTLYRSQILLEQGWLPSW